MEKALTEIHVPSSWIALLVASATSEFHELDMQLIKNISVKHIHCIN